MDRIIVGKRLMIPITVESRVSLVPNVGTIVEHTDESVGKRAPAQVNNYAELVQTGSDGAENADKGFSGKMADVAEYVWAAGFAAMLLYSAVSALKVRSEVREAVRSEKHI